MCGTVAWLQVKACGDDEQFDLAAWFPSLEYRAELVTSWPAFIFLVLRQRELSRVFDPRSGDEIDISDKFTANLHLIVRMDNKLRLPVSIEKTFTVIVKIHLKKESRGLPIFFQIK